MGVRHARAGGQCICTAARAKDLVPGEWASHGCLITSLRSVSAKDAYLEQLHVQVKLVLVPLMGEAITVKQMQRPPIHLHNSNY